MTLTQEDRDWIGKELAERLCSDAMQAHGYAENDILHYVIRQHVRLLLERIGDLSEEIGRLKEVNKSLEHQLEFYKNLRNAKERVLP